LVQLQSKQRHAESIREAALRANRSRVAANYPGGSGVNWRAAVAAAGVCIYRNERYAPNASETRANKLRI